MQATIEGEFLIAQPTKSGKGYMVSVLQENASCELYAPIDANLEFPARQTPVKITAHIRPGYEGKGFNATVKKIEVLRAGVAATAGVK